MSAMDHRQSDGICIHCHGRWPCEVAKIRRELAQHIRDTHVTAIGYPDYENGVEAGRDSAADSIDIEP